jgi:hypothetical protein
MFANLYGWTYESNKRGINAIEDNNIAPDKLTSGAFIIYKNIHIVSMPIPHSFNQILQSCNFIIRYAGQIKIML